MMCGVDGGHLQSSSVPEARPAVPGCRHCAEVGAMQRINSVARGPGGSAGSASEDGGEAAVRGQHSSVAGRELAGDEGILVVPLSNK